MKININCVKYLIYLYVLLKPFYFFSSGGLQISDFVFFLAFLIVILFSLKNKNMFKSVIMKNQNFLLFTLFTFFINVLYFLLYLKFKFILSSLYFLYNFFVIIIFEYLLENDDKFNFKNGLSNCFKIDILLQLVILLLGLGRYYGGYRYTGTFNDPNQFAYFIFLSFAYIFLINYKSNKNCSVLIYFMFSVFLILESASTGMFLGFMIFVILFLFKFFMNFGSIIKKYCFKILSVFLFLFFSIIVIFASNKDKDILLFINDLNVINRVQEKFLKLGNQQGSSSYSEMSLLEERGYDKIYKYPQYIFFGAGEGEYNRFVKAATSNEIHSTFPAILFYYGLIPLIIILGWLFNRFKVSKLDGFSFAVYVAILIESFTLLNFRQSLFWIIFILIDYLNCSAKKNEEAIL